ncbi:MAG: prepilin-type N-terminal cleavage/methylation domain-containing protein, partial [Planctomycetota bacterium]
MNSERRTNQGFTLIELIVAIAILAIMASFAGIVFKVSIEAYRIAGANTEIMQKLRAITDQLNSDLKGLRKDGEIFVVWTARPVDPAFDADDADGFLRLDRIMFFANGDFQTYHQHQGNIRGNVARISYMLANRREDPLERPYEQRRDERMLTRTQHILTADALAIDFREPDDTFSDAELDDWSNFSEYDKISLPEWKNMPWANKKVALATITGVNVEDRNGDGWGARIHPADPLSVHMLLCEGVGEFKIQGWYEAEQRWLPEIDWDEE